MTDPDRSHLAEVVRDALVDVAPDLDPAEIGDDDDFHDDLGLDSMDSLNLAVALYEATGVDVPERDYARMRTVAECVSYLTSRLSG